MQNFYLNITIYNKTNNWAIEDYKNLSWTQCFPGHLRVVFRFPRFFRWRKTARGDDIPIYYNFSIFRSEPHMEIGYTHYSETYNVHETIYEKPSFRTSAKDKHCLVIADGFFEWRYYLGRNYPYYIKIKDREAFTMAGLWDCWENKTNGEKIYSYTIFLPKVDM